MTYGINYEPPRNLTTEEWRTAEDVLIAVPHLKRAVLILKELNNVPTSARVLLPQEIINQGHEQHNNYFRKAQTPLRLTRVGTWAFPNGERYDRKLALIPWDNNLARPIAPTSARIPRLSFD